MSYCGWEGKETCDDCKRPKLVDFMSTKKAWRDVVSSRPNAGVLCLHCFVDRANKKKIKLTKKDFEDVLVYVIDEGKLKSIIWE